MFTGYFFGGVWGFFCGLELFEWLDCVGVVARWLRFFAIFPQKPHSFSRMLNYIGVLCSPPFFLFGGFCEMWDM